MPCLTAPAWPERPPPTTVATTSYCSLAVGDVERLVDDQAKDWARAMAQFRPGLGRGAPRGPPPRDQRDRGAAAERRAPREGARDAGQPEPRPPDGRCRDRLEPDGIRQSRSPGAVRRPRRLPGRDDRAVAPPVVRVARALPRPLPHDRRLRVRAAARAVAACRSSSAGAPSRRCSASAGSATATTRARPRRRCTPSGFR